MTWILDAHIHLSDPEYSVTMDETIRSMEMIGLKACAVSMDVASSEITLSLAAKSDDILPFVGIHPEKAADDLDKMLSLIQNNSANIRGIGEIGLDRTYCTNDDQFERQKLVFSKLLEQAEKLQMPVSVHSRKTLDDIFGIIPSYKIPGVLLHWFDGNKKQLRRAMDLGHFVSYGPAMIYAQDKQVLASLTSRDKLLVETDGPVRFSHCFEMRSAQISFIPSVVFALSQVLRQSYDDTVAMLGENARRYLRI